MKVIEFRGHERPVNQIQLNRDGDLLFTCGSDKIVNMYDLYTYERIGTFETSSACKTLDVSSDSEYLVTGCLDGKLAIYKNNGGAKIFELQRKNKIKFIEFSYSGDRILVLYEWENVTDIAIYNFKRLLQEAKTHQERKFDEFQPDQLIKLQQYSFMRAIWGPLDENLYATSEKGHLVKISLQGDEIAYVKAHEGEARSLVFSKDFSLLATCGSDGGKIFDPESLQQMRYFKTDVPMNTIALQPLIAEQKNKNDQKYHTLIAGGIASRDAAMNKKGGFEVHLCNIQYGEELGTISGHFSPINSLIFTRDGRGFISGAEEGVVKFVRFDNSYWENE